LKNLDHSLIDFSKNNVDYQKEFRKITMENGDGKFYEDWIELYKTDFFGN
jgi:hypothetical protein